MSTEKMEPVAYVTEVQDGKVLLLPRASIDANSLTPLYTASQLQAAVAAERERCVALVQYWVAGKEPAPGTYEFRCLEAIRQLGDEQ